MSTYIFIYMVKKTKEEATETRESILEAAAAVFVEKGVSKSSLDEIAKKAGVTRGAVYWHFKNKIDIFSALYEQVCQKTQEMIVAELEREERDPLTSLREICVQLLLDLEINPKKRQILTIFFLKCEYSGDMESFISFQAEKKQECFNRFKGYFEKAKEQGCVSSDADSELLTRALSSYITGVAHEYLRYPQLFNLRKNAVSLIDCFFLGIKNV